MPLFRCQGENRTFNNIEMLFHIPYNYGSGYNVINFPPAYFKKIIVELTQGNANEQRDFGWTTSFWYRRHSDGVWVEIPNSSQSVTVPHQQTRSYNKTFENLNELIDGFRYYAQDLGRSNGKVTASGR